MSTVPIPNDDAGRTPAAPTPYLRRRNPTVKFAVVLVLSLLLTVVLDPWTPLLLLANYAHSRAMAGSLTPCGRMAAPCYPSC